MADKPNYEELEQMVKELEKKIDEQGRMDERMRLLSLAVEQSSEGIAVVDLDGNLEYLNVAFARMHEYSVKELIGKNLSIFHTPQQMPSVEAANRQIEKTGNFKGEIWHVTRNGTEFPTLMHNSLLRDDTGNPIGIIGTLRDITDLKGKEAEIKASEVRFRELFNYMSSGVAVYEAKDNGNDFIFKDFNRAGERIENVKKENLLGKSVLEMFPGVKEFGLFDVFKRVWETGTPEHHPISLYKDNRITGWKENYVYKLPSGEIVTVYDDITERKQVEEALRDSEEFISSLLNNSPHPILVINPDTSVRYVSPALETLTGFSSEEIIGRKAPYPWWTEETMQKTGEDLQESMRKGAKKLEALFQKKNGERFRVEITSVPIRENGVFKYYLASWVDITDRKQAEEALRESEGKLNAMLQSIGDHMSMMDKDLNIIWTNKTAKGIFGNDVIGKKCYETYHQRKEPCEPYPCITLKAFQDGKIHEHDTQVIDKDGKKIFFHCTANVALRDKEGKPTAVLEISRDTTEHKQAALVLIERGKELENKTHELEEVNAALRVLLKHRDEDKKDLEDKVVSNVKKLVFPYVEKLNNSRLNDRQMVYLNIIKSNLEDIIAPFLQQLSSKYSDLTPNEIQVAGFVKDGKTTKEIAELLNSSTGTIDFHRNNLRKKLGLRNTKTNLRFFLLHLT